MVYGLGAEYDAKCGGFLLGEGLAFDGLGRELFVAKPTFFSIDRLFFQPPKVADGWSLCLRYQERECGEGHLLKPDGTHSAIFNRIEEGVELLAVRQIEADMVCLANLAMALEKNRAPAILAVLPCCPYVPHRPRRDETASGVLRMSAGARGQTDEVVFSDEISHGLGPGNVQVTLFVEGHQHNRRCMISGTEDLFCAKLQTAVELFPDSGTFVAAARVHCGSTGDLIIRWYARRLDDTAGGGLLPAQNTQIQCAVPENQHAIHLEPRVVLLYPGEQALFCACTANGIPCLAKPTFLQPDGGMIDRVGLYTAPQTEGIYKIKAMYGEYAQETMEALAIVLQQTAIQAAAHMGGAL